MIVCRYITISPPKHISLIQQTFELSLMEDAEVADEQLLLSFVQL